MPDTVHACSMDQGSFEQVCDEQELKPPSMKHFEVINRMLTESFAALYGPMACQMSQLALEYGTFRATLGGRPLSGSQNDSFIRLYRQYISHKIIELPFVGK